MSKNILIGLYDDYQEVLEKYCLSNEIVKSINNILCQIENILLYEQ